MLARIVYKKLRNKLTNTCTYISCDKLGDGSRGLMLARSGTWSLPRSWSKVSNWLLITRDIFSSARVLTRQYLTLQSSSSSSSSSSSPSLLLPSKDKMNSEEVSKMHNLTSSNGAYRIRNKEGWKITQAGYNLQSMK